MRTETPADELRAEAKQILNSLLKMPEGYSSGAVERLVDCVIGSAVLTVTELFVQSVDESHGEPASQEEQP